MTDNANTIQDKKPNEQTAVAVTRESLAFAKEAAEAIDRPIRWVITQAILTYYRLVTASSLDNKKQIISEAKKEYEREKALCAGSIDALLGD